MNLDQAQGAARQPGWVLWKESKHWLLARTFSLTSPEAGD